MTSELEKACIYLRPKPLTELDPYLPIAPLQDLIHEYAYSDLLFENWLLTEALEKKVDYDDILNHPLARQWFLKHSNNEYLRGYTERGKLIWMMLEVPCACLRSCCFYIRDENEPVLGRICRPVPGRICRPVLGRICRCSWPLPYYKKSQNPNRNND